MQTKYLEIAIEGAGSVRIEDADTVLNRIDGMKDLNAIIAAMTGRLYHGTEAADSVRVAALRNRLRASKGQNHTKQDIIDQLRRDLVRSDEARAEAEGSREHFNRMIRDLQIWLGVEVSTLSALYGAIDALKTKAAEVDGLRANQIPAPLTAQDIADMQSQWREVAAALYANPEDPDEVIRRASWPACPSRGRAPLVEGSSEARSVDAIIAATDDEAMLREMAAEDAARPNPVTEDIIKEAAAILGDPPLSDTDAAKMHDAMRACVWPMADRVRLCDSIQKYHYLPPLDSVLAWSVAQCEEADKWLQNVRGPTPAHIAEWELPF